MIVLKFTPRSPRWHAKRIAHARGGIVWVLAASNTALPFRHAVRRQDVRRLHHRRHHRRRRRRCRPSSLGRLTGQQCGSPPLHPVDRNRTKYSPLLSLFLFSPSSQRRVYLARTYTISGPYIGARELARSGIRARVRTQNASRCARRKITKVYSANATLRRVRARVCAGGGRMYDIRYV